MQALRPSSWQEEVVVLFEHYFPDKKKSEIIALTIIRQDMSALFWNLHHLPVNCPFWKCSAAWRKCCFLLTGSLKGYALSNIQWSKIASFSILKLFLGHVMIFKMNLCSERHVAFFHRMWCSFLTNPMKAIPLQHLQYVFEGCKQSSRRCNASWKTTKWSVPFKNCVLLVWKIWCALKICHFKCVE